MKKIILLVLLLVLCFFSHEERGTFSKICVYDCLGDPCAISVQVWELCPVTIECG